MQWQQRRTFSCVNYWYADLCLCFAGNQPSYNVQMYSSVEILRLFKRLVDLHKALSNYTSAAMDEYSATGLPVQRPVFLMYPNDMYTYDIKDQYMFGSDILVAPVIKPNVIERDVFLPNDAWVYVWNKTEVKSGRITVNAPIGLPPVFVRNSSSFRDDVLSLASYKYIPFKPHPPKRVSHNSSISDVTSSVLLVAFCIVIALKSVRL